MKIAMIDLGSNSARMTIFEGMKPIYNKRIYVRLSEGLVEDNVLKPAPMARTLEALLHFAHIIEKEGCHEVCTVATEAMRRAKNAPAFLKEIFETTGLTIDILSGSDEARYDFLASRDLIGGKSAFLLDVGGGSLELIYVCSNTVVDYTCLPFGAVVMTDRFGRDEAALRQFFTNTFSSLPFVKDAKADCIIGLGGAVRSLFAFAGRKKQGEILSTAHFNECVRAAFDMPLERLAALPEFAERHDILLAGLIPFQVISALSLSDHIILNLKGVREGMLTECLMQKN